MAELVTLAAPIPKPPITSGALSYLAFDIENLRIVAVVKYDNGETTTKTYDSTTSPTGASLLSSVNTANNSAGTSLIKRVYNRLIADGVMTGTVSGTPS